MTSKVESQKWSGNTKDLYLNLETGNWEDEHRNIIIPDVPESKVEVKSSPVILKENTNADGSLQNPTITTEAEELTKKIGSKTMNSIDATFWVDDDNERKSEFERIKKIWSSARYILYGPIERTEENKKPHCHVVIALGHSTLTKTILKVLPSKKYHSEKVRNFTAAREYAIKSNPDDILEWGTPLKQGTRSDLKKMFEKTNYDVKKIQDEYPDKYCQYRNGINDICQRKAKNQNILDWVGLEKDENNKYKKKTYEKPIVHWWSGETGAGKTLTTKNIIANKIIKENYNIEKIGLIDGFKNDFAIGEIDDDIELLIIDEFRGDMLKLHDLLKLIDGSTVNIKNSKLRIHPKEIFITSALKPEQCYPKCCGDAADSIKQLKRRITDEKIFYIDEESKEIKYRFADKDEKFDSEF